MATSKEISETTSRGSEEMFNNSCSPCSETGKMIEAKKFCADCRSYFCDMCLRDHNKFAALRSHQILDMSEADADDKERETDIKEKSFPTERCAEHGNIMEKYCRDHDVVCCQICTTIRHRSCKNVELLAEVAKGIKDKSEYKSAKDSLSVICERTKRSTAQRLDNLAKLNQHKEKVLEEVEQFQQKIVQKIKEATETTRKNILSEHEQIKKNIESEIEVLEAVTTTVTKAVQKLADANEVNVFSSVRSCKKVFEEGESVLNGMNLEIPMAEMSFKEDYDLQDKITSLTSLGVVKGVKYDESCKGKKAYKATLFGKFVINPNRCEITGVCVMDNGETVIADCTNHTIKRLNKEYTVKDSISVNGSPGDICKLSTEEVGVCILNDKNLHVVSLAARMNVSNWFGIESGNFGISCDIRSEKVFVCNGNRRLSVYSKAGALLRTYEKDEKGQPLFSSLRQVAYDNSVCRIYIADASKGLIALNENGKIEWEYKDAEIMDTWGICLLPDGAILVCGYSSNNIIQLDREGRKITTLIKGVQRPLAMAYDKLNSRLIVGCYSYELLVYSLIVD